MTWRELFARADEHEATLDELRAALEARRGDD
jgi:hypothetical protein